MLKILNFKSLLEKKIQINETTYELYYRVPIDFEYKAGQFVVIKFNPTYTRAYSIVEVKDNLLKLLIDVKPMGLASKYFIDTKINDEINILGPYGIFNIKNVVENKVFIATGSGIAPFIPMIYSLINDNSFNGSIYLLFGTRTSELDIAYIYFKDIDSSKFKYVQCVTREDPINEYSFKGRVNTVVSDILDNKYSNLNIDINNTEFYLCGSNEMINDTTVVLKSLGVSNIFMEKYG